MSQIGYANPQAPSPNLAPLGLGGGDLDDVAARRARLASILPLFISVTVHWVFLIAYWIPETSTFPAHQWWLAQLSPLVSKGLTSDNQPQVPGQLTQSGIGGLLLLLSGLALFWSARTRRWWGRPAMVVPTAVGLVVTLVTCAGLVISSTNQSSGVSVILMVVWVVAAGYATYHAYSAEPPEAQPKTWRSGVPFLAAYALIGPAPVAVGRCLFGGGLRDAAATLQVNTVALRLAGLLTSSTILLYLAGLLVGLTVWVAYQWWPPRRRLASVWLSLAVAASLLSTGWLAWPTNTAAEKRTTTLRYVSPAVARHFPCGSQLLAPGAPEAGLAPSRTLVASGYRCRTLTVYSGYRQVGTLTAGSSFSPIKAATPEGRPISGHLISADYGEVAVAALSDRLDGRASRLQAVRLSDGAEVWSYTCASRQALGFRFAAVPAGDAPALARLTIRERSPRVVVRCDGHLSSFDPVTGPAG